jgi:ribosomal protein L40E
MQFISKGTGISRAEAKAMRLRKELSEALNPVKVAPKKAKPISAHPKGAGLVPNKFGRLRQANRVQAIDEDTVVIIATGEKMARNKWLSILQREAVARRRERNVCIKCGQARDAHFATCAKCRIRTLRLKGEGFKLPLSSADLLRVCKVADEAGLGRGEWMKKIVLAELDKQNEQ